MRFFQVVLVLLGAFLCAAGSIVFFTLKGKSVSVGGGESIAANDAPVVDDVAGENEIELAEREVDHRLHAIDEKMERQRELARQALAASMGSSDWRELAWTQETNFARRSRDKSGFFASAVAAATFNSEQGRSPTDQELEDLTAGDVAPEDGTLSRLFYLSAVRIVGGIEDHFNVTFVEDDGRVLVETISR